MALSGNKGIALSNNVWSEAQTFGLWGTSQAHLFGNRFEHGKNNALLATLEGSSLVQGNSFVHNHHVACFNQSGGQVLLGNRQTQTGLATFSANEIVDGSITSGEGARGLTTQAFELNAGVRIRLLHNDLYNNSGWSVIPNRAMWPNGASVSVEANRMCSHRRVGGSTIGGDEAVQSEWLHRVGTRDCEAVSTASGVCGQEACHPPVRPRGGIQPLEVGEPGHVSLRWWAADVAAGSVTVLRDINLTAMPAPVAQPDSVRGLTSNGVEKLTTRSLADGGEFVSLHAEGYGVLDVTFITSESEVSGTNGLPLKSDDDATAAATRSIVN